MAPPSSRRSGFSKKAQYSVFAGYLLATLGAVLGLGLLALSFWQPQAFAPLRGAAQDAVSPAGEAVAVTRSGSDGIWSTITAYWNAGQQNADLREELEIARIRLAEADAGKGAKVFNKCKACHSVENGKNGTGPHLYDVVDREVDAVSGYGYSGALKNAATTWTPEELDEFLTNPKGYAPGTKMAFAGLKKPADRANLIAYLQTIGE